VRDQHTELIAPVAVRLLELDSPLVDVQLPPSRLGPPYHSLLAVVRLAGAPLGTATVPVEPDGEVSSGRLASGLLGQLRGELIEAVSRGDLPAPTPSASNGHASARPVHERALHRPSLSVVIPTCAAPVRLERCVRSVLACDYDDYEVIVVENRPGSSATLRMLRERFPNEERLRYVEERRPGASRARNTGLALADGDLVAFIDDDVTVDRAWLRHCAEAFDRADDVACVTGLILPLELETESQLLLEQFAGFGKGFQRRTYRLPEAREAHPLFPYTPGIIGSGANTVLVTEVARELGGFDEALGPATPAVGGEELDLYIRCLRQGCAIAYEPSALVWHEHPDGMPRLRRQAYRYGLGLGAMLAKQLVAGPQRRELVRAVPAGLRYAASPASAKNARKGAAHPRQLDWLERVGMLLGPAAYGISALTSLGRHLREWSPRGAAPDHISYAHQLVLPSGSAIDVVSFKERTPAPRRLRRSHVAARTRLEGTVVDAATAACVAAPLAVALGLPATFRLAAVLALLCLAPGAAVLARLRARLELGLVVGVSLASAALIGQSMLWLGAWSPNVFLYGVAVACLLTLAPEFAARRGRPKARLEDQASFGWSLHFRATVKSIRAAIPRVPPWAAGHAVVLTAALAAWGASLSGADLGRVDGFGLLSAMPPTYFFAFALLIAGFISAISRSVIHRELLALYVVALILVIHGTTPLLYDEPRYAWTFRHIGVINFIAHSGGAVNRDIDVYNNWPAFFALNAWFSSVTGVSPSSYAPWAQVFFNVANVIALRFALLGVTRDERLIWTSTLLFVLANFVGQDYLAPQAFGFLLSLIVLGVCLRCGPLVVRPRTRPGRWWVKGLQRFRGRLVRGAGVDADLPRSPLSPSGALVAGGVCSLAVIVSHQLSPVMLLFSLTALSLIGRRIPLWIPIVMGLVEAWWVSLAWPFLIRHFVLFDPNPGKSAQPAAAHGLAGLDLVTHASWVAVALLTTLAGIGLIRRLRAGHWDLAAAALILGPLFVVGVQSYGGEGRIRIYLFTLPWLCFLAAAACAPVTSNGLSRVRRSWRLALASAAVGVSLLFAYFGLEYINRISADDVHAATWFEEHAPRSSTLVSVMGYVPYRLTARYPVVYANSVTLPNNERYRLRRLGRADVARVKSDLRQYKRPRFIVLSPDQQHYTRLYGLLPPGSLRSLARALSTSPSFRLVYRRGDASIYEDVSRGRKSALVGNHSPRTRPPQGRARSGRRKPVS
jgi:GT2 family glycosyltransferase